MSTMLHVRHDEKYHGHCTLLRWMALLSLLGLAACGGGSGGGGGGDGGGGGGAGGTGPVYLPSTPYRGQVGAGQTQVWRFGNGDGDYQYALFGMDGDADLEVRESGAALDSCTFGYSRTQLAGSDPEHCVVNPGGQSVDIAVTGTTATGYSLFAYSKNNLSTTMPYSDGAVWFPRPMASNPLTFASARANSSAYYSVSGVTGSAHLLIGGTLQGGSSDLNLALFSDSGFTVPLPCTSGHPDQAAGNAVDCSLAAPPDTFYVRVTNAAGNDDRFYLVLDSAGFTGSGTDLYTPPEFPSSLSPASIAADEVDVFFYSSGTTSGRYLVSLFGLTADADLVVSGENDAEPSCNLRDHTAATGSAPEDCVLDGVSNVYAWVQAVGATPYHLQLYPAPPISGAGSNEGASGAPLSNSINNIVGGRLSTVAALGTSYYAITAITGPSITVAVTGISNTSANPDLQVWADADFTTPLPCTTDNTMRAPGLPESCTIASPPGAIYVRVVEIANAGSTRFILYAM